MVQVNHGSPSSASEHERSTDNLNQDQNADEDEPETETGQEQDIEMPKEESENEHLVGDQETNQEDGDDDQETNQEDGYDHQEEVNSQEGFDDDHQEVVEEEEPPVSSTSIQQTEEEVNQENNAEVDSVEDEGAEESRKRGRESSSEENEEQNDEEKEEDYGKEQQVEDQQVEEREKPQEQHPPEVDGPFFDAVLYSPTPPSPQSVDYARWVQYHSQLPLNSLGYDQSVIERHHSPENISERGLGGGNGGEDEEGEHQVNREKGKAILEDETKENYKEREIYSMMIKNCYDSDDPRDREILKAMLAYRLDNSIIPEIKQLHNFIKNESTFEISAEELSIKVLILQAKFNLIVEEYGLNPAFDELHNQEIFDLSKQIWG
ncbi:unnamed protein product [Fraxinus pennsylvanica]|uniref:Glabrous enhancer-binding protein-like DBD domain-containing protein n=1 Tax=Fraxinus pennsylvanica TaxID=56036 RepID=A0AAD1YTR8_9LAMI|nr:unnamed protein product [Fraxinus pennsylvanica]